MVSNREIRQLFDTIKELGDIVKRQNAKLDSLSVELENACKEVAEVKTELQTVRHKLDCETQSTEKENIHRGPVPKQLKVCANFCSSTVAIGVSFEASMLAIKSLIGCFDSYAASLLHQVMRSNVYVLLYVAPWCFVIGAFWPSVIGTF